MESREGFSIETKKELQIRERSLTCGSFAASRTQRPGCRWYLL